ncbi:MAG: DeoR/GlpR transcriptional regulator [Anaerolineales bacterium]|nr:DeoR/GlpR transcriptional regulator [Anaerolineales bacterium]
MLEREERLSSMLEFIRDHNNVSVSQLKARFNVSAVTIRKDLDELMKTGFIVRTFGGAMPAISNDPLESFNVRSRLRQSEKKLIGQAAAALIKPMESIVVDAGSTTLEIVRHLHKVRPVTVITPAVNVAMEACAYPDLHVIMPGGGMLDRFTLSVEGGEAEASMSRLHADKAFIGVRGVDFQHGLTDTDSRRILLKQAMIKAARQVIVVADSSKLNQASLFDVAPLEAVHVLVTDQGAAPEVVEQFQLRGLEVVIASRAPVLAE